MTARVSPGPLITRLLLFIALALGVGAATPAAADVLVLRASGPSAASLSPGRRLATGTRLALRAGDQLTLLDGRGTIVLSGPRVHVVGSRRFDRSQIVATWRPRIQTAGVRDLSARDAYRAAALVDQAVAQSAAGDFAASDHLLAEAEAIGVVHRVQCRLIRNTRVYNIIAQDGLAEARALPDSCAALPLPEALTEQAAELDREGAELAAALAVLEAH